MPDGRSAPYAPSKPPFSAGTLPAFGSTQPGLAATAFPPYRRFELKESPEGKAFRERLNEIKEEAVPFIGGAINSFFFGIPEALWIKLGPEDQAQKIMEWRAAHPGAQAGEIAGIALSMLVPGGAALKAAGKGAQMVGAAKAGNALLKAGEVAAGGTKGLVAAAKSAALQGVEQAIPRAVALGLGEKDAEYIGKDAGISLLSAVGLGMIPAGFGKVANAAKVAKVAKAAEAVESAGAAKVAEAVEAAGVAKVSKAAEAVASGLVPGKAGPSGNVLVKYEHRATWGERESLDGGLVSGKVSDWERSEVSTPTGRDIVHVYWIKDKDTGEVLPYGIDAAKKKLGITNKTNLEHLAGEANAEMRKVKEGAGIIAQSATERGYDELNATMHWAQRASKAAGTPEWDARRKFRRSLADAMLMEKNGVYTIEPTADALALREYEGWNVAKAWDADGNLSEDIAKAAGASKSANADDLGIAATAVNPNIANFATPAAAAKAAEAVESAGAAINAPSASSLSYISNDPKTGKGLLATTAEKPMVKTAPSEERLFVVGGKVLRPGEVMSSDQAKKVAATKEAQLMNNRAYSHRANLADGSRPEYTDTHIFGERTILDPKELFGKVGVQVQGDRSRAGQTLDALSGIRFSEPVPLQGGPDFPQQQRELGKEYGWASGLSAARNKQNNFKKAADETGQAPIGIYSSMGPDAVNFATPPAEILIQKIPFLKIKKADIASFNSMIRERYPFFSGVDHPEAISQIRGIDEDVSASAGGLRKLIAERSMLAEWRAKGFPDYSDIVTAVNKPDMLMDAKGTSGYSMFQSMPDRPLVPTMGSHLSYDTYIPGKYIGGLETAVPPQIMFPKTWSKKAAEGKNPDQIHRSMQIGGSDFEPFDQEWLDNISTYLENARR